jgi:predicted nucleotidyltransferase component of viral defense system
MIDQSQLTTTWIKQVAKERKTDPLLVEKVSRALLLLEGLVKQNLPLIFKGGTALMLYFDSTKRLSIDIDIILSGRPSNIEKVLNNLIKEQGFSRWEHQERQTESVIQKKHYKLYYEPLYKTHKEEEYVLLDILIEDVKYALVNRLPIRSSFVPQRGDPILVDTASVEDLLGDKLTAFAPYTTGIPYVKGTGSMSMEIIKQLYDIGNLFDSAENMEVVKTTFRKFVKMELAYRHKNNLKTQAVLEDIYQTSLSITTRGKDIAF